MAELNLKQITDRLNSEFTGESRKLVFWYDDNGEFAEDIDALDLQNAKVYKLQQDNQFYTKYFLERVDTTTSYLVYAPFPKPDIRNNHLEDIVLYSKRFYADRASLLTVDLGIEEKYKPIIEKHIKFFANKDRTQAFYDLEIENFREENIITGLLCSLCKAHICSFEEVIRTVLTDSDLKENTFLSEFDKYDLTKSFWTYCEQHMGYVDPEPTLEKMVVTMFVTYAEKYIHCDLPKQWGSFRSIKAGNIIAFLDNLMNSVLYRKRFDELAEYVEKGLNTKDVFAAMNPEDILDLEVFKAADDVIISWMMERLIAEDTGANLSGLSITEIADMRSKMHFGKQLGNKYKVLRSAYRIIMASNYAPQMELSSIIDKYAKEDYQIDQEYRWFYYRLDQLDNPEELEKIRVLVENIYANEYLAQQLPKWTDGFRTDEWKHVMTRQQDFFDRNVKYTKDKTAVIISDAMRYEVARELLQRMQDDPKCMPESKISMMLSVLPSYTKLGMAALLPHKALTMTDSYEVLADDMATKSTEQRNGILQKVDPEGACIQFEEIKAMKSKQQREYMTGKHAVYIYHNAIDAAGDDQMTENTVFDACERAVADIILLIQKLAAGANTYRFIVTSDHGFLYRRNPLEESDKIGGIKDTKAEKHRRFILSQDKLDENGVISLSIGSVINNEDSRMISFPVSSNVFKASGGMNYVHGGASPQEMIVPVVEIKMDRGKQEIKNAEIALVSMIQKITNLFTTMEFIQSEPVSDTIKAAKYQMYFISEDNEKVSNENILAADSRDTDPGKRRYRLRFNFKNKKYDKDKQYYLVAYDITDENFIKEVFRHPVIMDLAFGEDFGF